MEPFDALIEIAHRSHQAARDLPPRRDTQTHWMGLGFMLLGHRFVVPMSEVVELMRVPGTTYLPGVKNWLSGIANVRGRLMTLIDLSAYFGLPVSRARAQRRVYVLEGDDYYYGFIVDESLGMQHFSLDNHRDSLAVAPDILVPYLRGSYDAAGIIWPVVSLLAVAEELTTTSIAV